MTFLFFFLLKVWFPFPSSHTPIITYFDLIVKLNFWIITSKAILSWITWFFLENFGHRTFFQYTHHYKTIRKKQLSCNYIIVVKDTKLHKTLVATMDEINGQPTFHHLYMIVCHMYITMKIDNLHNDVAKEKGLRNICFRNR
jgi:hypothetical protein